MTDCCNNSNESTCSSDVISSLRRNNSRIRIVRLIRPQSSNRSLVLGRGTSLYGFALRGGREFGTGFFISNIEKGSQADLKGLKVRRIFLITFLISFYCNLHIKKCKQDLLS